VHAVLTSHQLSSGASLVLSAPGAADKLNIVVGGGRGCVLRADGPLAGLWLPLRGRLQLSCGGVEGTLLSGEVRISEPESGTNAIGRGNALWIALLGTRAAWCRALERSSEMPMTEPILLPTWHAADRKARFRR
jgi:AraC family transcriptional regulator